MASVVTRTVMQVGRTAPRKQWGGFVAVVEPGKELFDPFLFLVDHDHVLGPRAVEGFPPHPHRGFETVTYVLDGGFDHGDSAGNSGTYGGPGDVQWMTAGRGVLHSEMFKTHPTRRTTFKGFQLWINLPRRLKMTDPSYQMIWAQDMPRYQSAGVDIKVIAGHAGDVQSPIRTHVPLTYLHVKLAPGARWTQPVPAAHNALAYVFAGTGTFGPASGQTERVPTQSWALFAHDGDQVEVENREQETLQLLYFDGQPLKEPIAQRGPFVMNTPQEVQQANIDFYDGKFGELDMPYRSNELEFPERFAHDWRA